MKRWLYVLLLLIVIVLAAIPFFLYPEGEFAGADGLAEEMIMEINPSYQRWLEPLWEPPSGEVESLLFALQAAIGGVFIGFYIGRMTGRTTTKKIKEQ